MNVSGCLRVLILCVCMVSCFASQAQTSEPASAAAVVADDSPSEYRLPPDELAKAEALYRSRVTMFVVGTVYGLGVLLAVLALRIAPRLRDLAERSSSRRVIQLLIFAPLLLWAIDLLSLPVALYAQHLQRAYGLSVQGWGSWLWDWTKGEVIGTFITTLAIWGLYAFLRRSPTRWWLYFWVASIPVVLLLVLIQPIFIDPLFNEFQPLEARQPQLLQQLERVTQRGGLQIERSRMFEMQASDKVTTYNAYVTGIGASKRVVVWDNTARDLSIPETMFVFGHEQGHYVLNHVWKLLTFAILGLLIALYLAHRLVGGVLARWGRRWGIREVSDLASLPALLLLLSVFSLVGQPLTAGFSRYLEHQADIYGLEVIHGLVPDSSRAAVRAFQKLGEKGLAYPHPNPLYVFWVFDHPPLPDRIKFAAQYRPWEQGEAARYIN